jgi:hypothetical protein
LGGIRSPLHTPKGNAVKGINLLWLPRTRSFPLARKFGRGGPTIATMYFSKRDSGKKKKSLANVSPLQILCANDSGFYGEGCNSRVTTSFSKKAKKENVGSSFNQPKTA